MTRGQLSSSEIPFLVAEDRVRYMVLYPVDTKCRDLEPYALNTSDFGKIRLNVQSFASVLGQFNRAAIVQIHSQSVRPGRIDQ